jgi:hypothetical protein
MVRFMQLAAHGRSSEDRWPYGSVATSFIAYGKTDLIIMQDLPGANIHNLDAEMTVREMESH